MSYSILSNELIARIISYLPLQAQGRLGLVDKCSRDQVRYLHNKLWESLAKLAHTTLRKKENDETDGKHQIEFRQNAGKYRVLLSNMLPKFSRMPNLCRKIEIFLKIGTEPTIKMDENFDRNAFDLPLNRKCIADHINSIFPPHLIENDKFDLSSNTSLAMKPFSSIFDSNEPDFDALTKAVREGKIDPDFRIFGGAMPLLTFIAYKANNFEFFKTLIEYGAMIECVESISQCTPLAVACFTFIGQQKDLSYIELLLKSGANIEAEFQTSRTEKKYKISEFLNNDYSVNPEIDPETLRERKNQILQLINTLPQTENN